MEDSLVTVVKDIGEWATASVQVRGVFSSDKLIR